MKGLSRWRRWFFFIAAVLAAVILDQGSKLLFFARTYAAGIASYNTGISFSILRTENTTLIIGGILVFLVAGAVAFWKVWLRHAALSGLILGSALSNVLDRIWFGGVRDWLSLPIVPIQNNLADWLLCFALVSVAILEWRIDKARRKVKHKHET